MASEFNNTNASYSQDFEATPSHNHTKEAAEFNRTNNEASNTLHQPLKIEIISATGLRDSDWFLGSSDTYVVCEIPNKPKSKVKTITSQDDAPVWNHKAEITDYAIGDSLSFTVWDDDHLKDDVIGKVVVDSAKFHPAGFDGNLLLEDNGKKGGKAFLRVKIGDPTPTQHAANAHVPATGKATHEDIHSKGESFSPPQATHKDIHSKGENVSSPQAIHEDIRSKGENFGPPQATHEDMRSTGDNFSPKQAAHEDIRSTGENFSPQQAKTTMSSSMPALGDYKDIKQKTEFTSVTVDGVLKRTTYMTSASNFRTSPKYSLGPRGESAFIRSSTTPAPGSYNMPTDDKAKFKGVPKYSFGGSSRFGLGAPPTKRQPGPGAYNPRDPVSEVATKVGFSTSIRNKGGLLTQANPGPGAYEFRSSIGSGRMYTARGRHVASYTRSRSQPGPGAYSPVNTNVQGAAPKCGFGTSTRTDVVSSMKSAVMPGPGTYELQNFRSTGSDAPKYSATSRRRMHDLNSYVTPGPGSYNSHTTSFGY